MWGPPGWLVGFWDGSELIIYMDDTKGVICKVKHGKKHGQVTLLSCTAWEPGSLILVATGRSSQMSYQSCFFCCGGRVRNKKPQKVTEGETDSRWWRWLLCTDWANQSEI